MVLLLFLEALVSVRSVYVPKVVSTNGNKNNPLIIKKDDLSHFFLIL